jgi:hypothetical protein
MKYLLITITIILSGAFFLNSAAAQNCRSEKRGYCVELASLAQAQMLEEFFGTNSVREPGDIIPALYKFGLGLVAISALGALIVGGVYYMTAGGSQDRTKKGRTWLGNGVFGLILALLSFLILNTINPDLVKKLDLRLEPIKQEKTDTEIKTVPVELPKDIKDARDAVGTITVFSGQPDFNPATQTIYYWVKEQREECTRRSNGQGVFRSNQALTGSRPGILVWECVIPPRT